MEMTLKATPLLSRHQHEKAKLVPFAGWQMPLEYRGILGEHRMVRKDKGLFDLSHMGEIEVSGADHMTWLNKLVSGNVMEMQIGQALYTVMCREDGGILDDLVVYRDDEKCMLVVNASNTDKILAWMQDYRLGKNSLDIKNRTDEVALLSIQGPNAQVYLETLCSITLAHLPYYHFQKMKIKEIPLLISRTGYTGEDGFELFLQAEKATALWDFFRGNGADPVGLGARDTLRLESGYLLYGNDMDETTNPLEVGLSWVVKFEKGEFIGKNALVKQKESRTACKLIPFIMEDRCVARKDYNILLEGKVIGRVTSGTFSPTLEKGIGMGIVEALDVLVTGKEIHVQIRGESHPARVSKKPFVSGSVKRGS